MKKTILLLFTLLTGMLTVQAEDGVSAGNATIPQNGTGIISIDMTNSEHFFTAFTFKLTLPEGLGFALDAAGRPVFESSTRFSDHNVSSSASGQTATFACLSLNSTPIGGTQGTLLNVSVRPESELAVGTVLPVMMSELTFTTPDEQEVTFDDVTFYVTIGTPIDMRTVLDETSTTMPTAATGVDVRVKRTIKANEWSTLCLPFSMTGEQVKEAFGEDVQLADFTGYEVTEDEDENVVGITVNFGSLTKIEANHPCLIRVSSAISEFTVDGVDIDPEEEPVVAAVKRTRKAWSELVGTYVAGTEVPEKTLFLSGNEFWYSTGATKMKGFRAYFDFYDVLTEVDENENYANVRFVFSEGETTGVRGVGDGIADHTARDGVYTLQGVKVDGAKTLPKGLYVVDGKKVMVK